MLLLPALCPAAPITIQAGTFGIDRDCLPGLAEWIKQQANEFTTAYPGIKVDLIGLEDPSRYDVPIEENPLLARNVVGVDAVSGYDAAWLAARADIVPLEKFMPDPDFSKEDFFENLWPPVMFDGQTWAVPLAVAPLLFAYRADFFEAERADGPPETWEALADCLEQTAGELPKDTCMLHVDDMRQTALTMLLQQGQIMRGGRFAPEISHITRTLSVIEAIEQNRIENFRYNRRDLSLASMILGSPGTLNQIPRSARSKLKIAPLPSWDKNVQFPYQAIYLAVRSARPEYEKASWEFVKWLTRSGAPPPATSLAMPCRKNAQTPESPFQDTRHIRETLPQVIDYGPNNLLARRHMLQEFANVVEEAFDSGGGINLTKFEENLNKLNNRLEPIGPPSRAPYALYR